MTKQINKFIYYFLAILLVWLPVGSFVGQILVKCGVSDPFWLIHWYEPILIFLCLISLLFLFRNRPKISSFKVVAFLIMVLSSVSVVFLSSSISVGLQGFRFAFLSILLFLCLLQFPLSSGQKKNLISIYLITSLAIAFLAIVERFFPLKYWELWRVVSQNSGFGWGYFAATDKFWQSSSLIGAPNQLASYLLPAFFILVSSIKYHVSSSHLNSDQVPAVAPDSSRLNTYYLILAAAITALAIILTSSRSAYIGLIAGFVVYLFFFNKSRILKYVFSGLVGISILASIFLFQVNPNFRQLATHNGQTGHQNGYQQTAAELKNRLTNEPAQFFLGTGLGSAGPLTIKYGNGIISESWYLQLFLEVGLVGICLWLIFISLLSKELISKREAGLFLGLLAVSITAIFLHTWADNPAMSLTFFAILGITLGENYGKNSN